MDGVEAGSGNTYIYVYKRNTKHEIKTDTSKRWDCDCEVSPYCLCSKRRNAVTLSAFILLIIIGHAPERKGGKRDMLGHDNNKENGRLAWSMFGV